MSASITTVFPAWTPSAATATKKMYLLHTVISSYEINDIVQLIQEVDENVIINVFKTEDFYGGFYRESLD